MSGAAWSPGWAAPARESNMDTTNGHYLACPCCGQLDRVEKVSAVYTAGCSTGRAVGLAGTFDHGWVPTPSVIGMATTHQTVLSQQLAPPHAPRVGRAPVVKHWGLALPSWPWRAWLPAPARCSGHGGCLWWLAVWSRWEPRRARKTSARAAMTCGPLLSSTVATAPSGSATVSVP